MITRGRKRTKKYLVIFSQPGDNKVSTTYTTKDKDKALAQYNKLLRDGFIVEFYEQKVQIKTIWNE